ncbi:glutamine synthetase-like [Symsagittifera roscoffensis]|uniref:glutamine synthetase-like n=1 Tax=Symsagittifera roscoffensis TaxID=84072 RepID=UPI00307C35AC
MFLKILNFSIVSLGRDTFHLCPWSGSSGKSKIAEVICSFHWKESLDYQGIDSRHQCEKQLKCLKDEFGFDLYSALEYEFVLMEGKHVSSQKGKGENEGAERKKLQPVFRGTDICSTFEHKKVEEFHIEVHRRLLSAGIIGRTYQVELGDAQNEITLPPAFGVRAGDEAFMLKSCVKETAWDVDKHASFMSKPFADGESESLVTNSGHFNHSLWDEHHNNVFYDPQNEHGFSKYQSIFMVAHWWAGGIMRHARALCALVCPTANCYRRIVPGSWAPRKSGWALDRRDAFIRCKNESKSGTYFECRTPSGAANPYLVMAGIVAAGLDGLRNKVEPPPMGVSNEANSILLPKTLLEAVEEFERDTELNSMFGEEFTRWFCEGKRQTDCKVNTFEQERQKYWKLI